VEGAAAVFAVVAVTTRVVPTLRIECHCDASNNLPRESDTTAHNTSTMMMMMTSQQGWTIRRSSRRPPVPERAYFSYSSFHNPVTAVDGAGVPLSLLYEI